MRYMKINKKGFFLVIEGIDACGKGTQIKNIVNYLFDKDKSNHILLTREPTMISKYGKKVRWLLENKKDPRKDHRLFSDLYIKDRKFHIQNIISPALKKGCIVVSDRYKYSTFAYQLAQGEDLSYLKKSHKNFIIPNLTIIIDISENESIKRLKKSGQKKELFEKIDFLSEVRNNYLSMKDIFPNENIRIISGIEKKEKVFEKIKKEIDEFFK